MNSSATISDETTPIPLSNLENTVFGVTDSGQLNGTLNLAFTNTSATFNITFSVCSVRPTFVRDTSFERRHPQRPAANLYKRLAEVLCKEDSEETHFHEVKCQQETLKVNDTEIFFSANSPVKGKLLVARTMYFAMAYFCKSDMNTSNSSLEIEGELSYLNLETSYPELGFEEALFPILAQVVLYSLAATFFVLLLSLVLTIPLRLPIRQISLAVLFACFMKGFMALLTFLYFSNIARTGFRARWYVYARIGLTGIADVLFVAVVVAISSGYRIFPNVWFIDGKSPVMFVYVAITLQILITIAVKIVFPFKYLSAFPASASSFKSKPIYVSAILTAFLTFSCRYTSQLRLGLAHHHDMPTRPFSVFSALLTYCLAAGAVAGTVLISSHRNHQFLGRYAHLIERAHIHVKTTPILRMRRFYAVNTILVPVVYFFKIISVGLWDYYLRLPDHMWGSLEITDTILLMWCAFAVLPRKKSAIYVDLSNVSNARLQEADAWRASQEAETDSDVVQSSHVQQVRNQATTTNPDGPDSDDDNAAEERGANMARERGSEPRPPWISWSSGMSLPRPNSSTWGNLVEVTRILRRERRFVPVLPTSIVIGTASDSPDTVHLNIGVPTTGPDSIPRSLDEKGNEIPRNRANTVDRPIVTRMRTSTREADTGSTARDAGQVGAPTRVSRFAWLQNLFRRRERSAEAGQGLAERNSSNRARTSSADAMQNANQGDERSTASSVASCDGIIVVSN